MRHLRGAGGRDSILCRRACAGAEGAWDEPAFEACIKHEIVTIGFSLRVLLALDFNGDEFLCAVFWVHNGRRLSARDVLLGGPSII
jgi:hypothetical protein